MPLQIEEVDDLAENTLNQQSALLWKWRVRILALLTQGLTQGGDEADGQEYTRSLEIQGEAETYLQAYTALLADRRQVLVAERNLLAAHDAKELKVRQTKAAREAAASALPIAPIVELEEVEGMEKQVEHEVLLSDLMEKRKSLLENTEGRAVKSIVFGKLLCIKHRCPSNSSHRFVERRICDRQR